MARHSHVGGRFDVLAYEQKSIFDGIDSELRAPVGAHVLWVIYDPETSTTDRIYDVADYQNTGRQWKFPPIRIPAYVASIFQGMTVQDERGFYNTDVLHMSVASNVIENIFPELVWEPDAHIKDRILYRGRVFVPNRFSLRGLLRDSYTVFSVEAFQVKPEEYVNDSQLSEWAARTLTPGPFDPNMKRVATTW